jgi:hypothetical protein
MNKEPQFHTRPYPFQIKIKMVQIVKRQFISSCIFTQQLDVGDETEHASSWRSRMGEDGQSGNKFSCILASSNLTSL